MSGGDIATIVSAGATAVYAAVSAISLFLLSHQIRDARRFGAAPALYALLKELEEHIAAVRTLDPAADDGVAEEAILRFLEFFERVEHLRSAGVLPADVLARAFGPVLSAYLADDRFRRVIDGNPQQHEEVTTLARQLARPPASRGWRYRRPTTVS